MIKILSINVSLPQSLRTIDGRSIFSGISKKSVNGSIYLDHQGLTGDGVGNTAVHGGSDKALCVYNADYFSFWSKELRKEIFHGAFGENLSITGLTEKDVFIGDIFRIGEAEVQCSQPRQPCRNLSSFIGESGLVERIRQTGYSGFYLRVLKPGWISPGDVFEILNTDSRLFSVDDVNALLYRDKTNFDKVQQLVSLNTLSQSVREEFQRRLNKAGLGSLQPGEIGGNGG